MSPKRRSQRQAAGAEQQARRGNGVVDDGDETD